MAVRRCTVEPCTEGFICGRGRPDVVAAQQTSRLAAEKITL